MHAVSLCFEVESAKKNYNIEVTRWKLFVKKLKLVTTGDVATNGTHLPYLDSVLLYTQVLT